MTEASLTYETFAGCVGEEFEIALDPLEQPCAHWLTVRLAEITAGDAATRPDASLPFAMIFSGPPSPVLAQRIYQMRHRALGAFSIFLVPLTPEAQGTRYEAVFN